jgi:hypothetical protein
MNSPGTMMQKRAWLLALVTGLVAVAPGASAEQQQQMPQQATDAGQAQTQVVTSANVEVMLLHATNVDGGGSIDPAIGRMPALQKPPFSSYNTYKLISRTTSVVSRSAPTTTKLPNDRVLQITLRDVVQASRYRVATSINQPGGTTFLPLLEVTTPAGDPFFVAGQAYQGGMLVIGIKVIK